MTGFFFKTNRIHFLFLSIMIIGFFGFVNITQANTWQDLTDSLVAHYKMNDNLATTNVIDSKGLFNGVWHSINGAPDWLPATTAGHSVEGKINRALEFEEFGDYDTWIDTQTNFLSTFKSDFTISYWAKQLGDWETNGSSQEVFGECDGSNIIKIFHYSDKKLGFVYQNLYVNTSSEIFSLGWNDWKFIVVRVSQINETQINMSLFVNGVEVANGVENYVMNNFDMYDWSGEVSGAKGAVIGNSNHEGLPHEIQWYRGYFDNLMIFNKALSQNEVTYLYNSTNGTELDDAAVPTPGSITFSNITTTSITASSTGATDDTTLAVLPYRYHNVTSNTYSDTSSSSWTVTDLTPNTSYTFEVAVQDISGNWATSTTYTTTTLALPVPTISSTSRSQYTSRPLALQSLLPITTTVLPPVSTPSVTPPKTSTPSFTRNLEKGMTGNDVKQLQVFLNTQGYPLASSGPGSVGNETNYFGPLTKSALIKFQETYAKEILAPLGLTSGTGVFGEKTRQFMSNQ